MHTYFNFILNALSSHPYIFIFIGMLFAGETILLPSVYFALSGDLVLSYVAAVALVSTVISDLFWYWIGSHMSEGFSQRLVSPRIQMALEKLSGAFSHRAMLVLFLSKFVYGTRIAAHVLAGLKRLPMRAYLCVNVLGSLALIVFVTALSYTVDATVANLSSIMHTLEITLLVVVVTLVLAHLALGAYIKKTWYQ